MKKKALRYVLWEKEWIGCEERFCLYDEMLGYLVEELFHKEKYQEAYSIIVRYDLLSKGLINKKEPKEYFEKHKEYKILDNPIFEKDSFNPVEENVEKVKEGYYINLRDFGIKEENVYYIDDIKDSLFHYSMKQLEKSEMV